MFGVSFLVLFVVLGISFILTKKKSPSSSPRGHLLEENLVKEEDSADVVIIGAGIVGAALAHSLGNQGKRVVLIERDMTEPNRIVGELMQPGGVAHIKSLGLEGKEHRSKDQTRY